MCFAPLQRLYQSPTSLIEESCSIERLKPSTSLLEASSSKLPQESSALTDKVLMSLVLDAISTVDEDDVFECSGPPHIIQIVENLLQDAGKSKDSRPKNYVSTH
ncbi:hypothetical protein PanWU01x14_050310 [Parasponia andersonii]|uniref:Uncharacterized protein n=1 Tax=Parasponia andersonii TaxID=3476 RepID=A0A2P5DLM7_PARAD|nr:hypothetical protein PanWU01x14_050310 [Parasponia andersonii]